MIMERNVLFHVNFPTLADKGFLMDRLVSLSVGTVGPENYVSAFQAVAALAVALGETHAYVNVTASVVDEEMNDGDLDSDDIERSHFKIHEALVKAGFADKTASYIISTIQNAGILFRERA